MGIFGGLKKAFKGYDLMGRLQVAGALANGDYGSAAQIQGLQRKQQQDQAQAEAERQQAEAAVAALVARGIPEQEARIIAQGGMADSVLADRNGQPSEDAFDRAVRLGQIDPNSPEGVALYRQRAGTMASPAPQMIGSPETGYRWVQPPAPGMPAPQAQPQTPATGQQPITAEMYRGAVNGLGAEGAAAWVQRNNHIVAVRSPQEARQLPSGTRIRLPDGTEGRVP